MTAPNTVGPGSGAGYVGVAPDTTGKKIANYSVQMYIDNQDGLGPVLQTVYFQAVDVFALDENGTPLTVDDRVDYEWKRQLLDEMRAIRIGIEHLMETGRPSFDATRFSLIEEARIQRIDDTKSERLEQEA